MLYGNKLVLSVLIDRKLPNITTSKLYQLVKRASSEIDLLSLLDKAEQEYEIIVRGADELTYSLPYDSSTLGSSLTTMLKTLIKDPSPLIKVVVDILTLVIDILGSPITDEFKLYSIDDNIFVALTFSINKSRVNFKCVKKDLLLP